MDRDAPGSSQRRNGIEAIVRPVTDACTRLLTEGWLRYGRLGVNEASVTA